MIPIKSVPDLVNHGQSDIDKKLRKIALTALEKALKESSPKEMFFQNIQRVEQDVVNIGGEKIDLSGYNRIFAVGGGKASGILAESLEQILEDKLDAGLVVIPQGTKGRYKTEKIELIEARHPIPNKEGVAAAKRIVELCQVASERDLMFCLISGGGSSLMTLPKERIRLKDKQHLTNMMLDAGATIFEMNCVRKHLSQIKGGQLALKIYPASTFSLIVSDVVGNSLDVIASGPTVPDTTTYQDAVDILKKYRLWQKTPVSVRRLLCDGVDGRAEETPKDGHRVFDRVRNTIIGGNRSACQPVLTKAALHGYNTLFLTSSIQGEARHVGTVTASIAKEILIYDNPIHKPACIVLGGETTVTVRGRGLGGRNQELVLSAAMQIDGLKHVTIASIGTDGIDGPTDAAGAIADGQTITRAKKIGLDPRRALEQNNSYRFFQALGDLIITGPTGTNVGDVLILLIQ